MFKGSISALITPMQNNGEIDFDGIANLVELHKKSKTEAIVLLGTTGENPTIEHKEKLNIVKFVKKQTNGEIPLIVGTGSNSTQATIDYTKEIDDIKVDAVMVVSPYYNKPSQKGIIEHYKAIAKCSSTPQIIYNVPARTSVDMSNETISILSKIPNIIGCKEASGDISRVKKLKEMCTTNFALLSGDDMSFIDFIEQGGHGVISVINNTFPKEIYNITKLALNNEIEESKKMFKNIENICKAIYIESNPMPIKWLAMHLGLIKSDKLRLPLTTIEEKNKKLISEQLKKFKKGLV